MTDLERSTRAARIEAANKWVAGHGGEVMVEHGVKRSIIYDEEGDILVVFGDCMPHITVEEYTEPAKRIIDRAEHENPSVDPYSEEAAGDDDVACFVTATRIVRAEQYAKATGGGVAHHPEISVVFTDKGDGVRTYRDAAESILVDGFKRYDEFVINVPKAE